MNNTFTQRICHLITGLFLLMILFILTLLCFFQNMVDVPYQKGFGFNFIYIICGLLLLFFLLHQIPRIHRVQSVRRLRIACLLLFCLQLFITSHIWFYAGFDVGVLRISAQYFAVGDVYPFAPYYFATNPNNIGILFITSIFVKFGSLLSIDGYFLLIVFGVFLSTISLYLLCRCLQLLQVPRLLYVMGFLLGAFLFGLSPWITIPYSDILSMPIPIATIYLFIRCRQKKEQLPLWKRTLLVSVLPLLGSLLKPTNLIPLIALGIFALCQTIQHIQDKKWKKQTLISVLASLMVLLLLSAGTHLCDQCMRHYLHITPDPSIEKSYLHYAMMGLNTETIGNYSKKDDDFSTSFRDYDEKKNANLQQIKLRLHDMGFSGYLTHVSKKTICNFGNGTFGWGKEGTDFASYIPPRDDTISHLLCGLYYANYPDADYSIGNGGSLYWIFLVVSQFLWISLLLLLLCSAIGSLLTRKTDSVEMVLCLSLLGIFFMVTLFETNARYLISFLPLFILQGCRIPYPFLSQTKDEP